MSADSQQLFGFEWLGWWFVSVTIPFGWKNSPFVYQTVGLASSSFFRDFGVVCTLYIDDRLIGEIFSESGNWSRPIEFRDAEFSAKAAEAALYIVCRVLVALGYFIGINKSVLSPMPRIVYLGMLIDSNTLSFSVPHDKRVKFAKLREDILTRPSNVSLKSLQKFLGKCMSFSLAFPGAKFFVREISGAIGRASRGANISLNSALRQEIQFWRFLDSWEGYIPWRKEGHVDLHLSTDASSFRWSATVHFPSGDFSLGDYWSEDQKGENINVKEMWAVLKTVQSLPQTIRDCRIEMQVDNMATLHAWEGKGPKSVKLCEVSQQLFHLVTERNVSLSLKYVPSALNPADQFSRALKRSDAMLSQRCWAKVQEAYGGLIGHNLDLMALDSNVHLDNLGSPLRHFTPYPTPDSAGVNVFNQDLSVCDGETINAYVFPPFSLMGPILRFIRDHRAVVTVVAPKLFPRPTWWPIINSMALSKIVIAQEGEADALLFPTKNGFQPGCVSFQLWAFRVGTPTQP